MQASFSLFFSRTLLFLLCCGVALHGVAASTQTQVQKSRFTVVIDPGHGGRDAGAVGQISKEKDINLKVALAFGKLIEKKDPQVRVIYTRSTDTFVTLQGRADIANRTKANLFISIHTNSLPAGKNSVSGAETYTLGMHRAAENLEVAKRENSVITQEAGYQKTYKNFDPRKSESYIIFEFMQDLHMQQSVDFARRLQKNYAQRGRKNKGVHQAGFLVLRATSMPSVLTELGFISNPEEERFMNSAEGIETLSRSLYEAFRSYRQQYAEQPNATDENKNPLLMADNEPEAFAQPLSTSLNSNLPSAYQPTERELLSAALLDQEALNQNITAEVVPLAALPYPKSLALHEAAAPLLTSTSTSEEQKAPQPQPIVPTAGQQQANLPTPSSQEQVALNPAEKVVVEKEKVVVEKEKVFLEKAQKMPPQTPASTTPPPSQAVPPKREPLPNSPKSKALEKNKEEEHPIFKVQILTSERKLSPTDEAFQGIAPIEHYLEGNRYKYTTGHSTQLNEIKKLRTQVAEKFPQAFVIATLKGERIPMQQALELSRDKTKAASSPVAPKTQGTSSRK